MACCVIFRQFVTGLQDTTLALYFRVTVLEENGGDDGNSSVAELEVRVETLEGTTADHGTRISNAETYINGEWFTLSIFLSDHFTEELSFQLKVLTPVRRPD